MCVLTFNFLLIDRREDEIANVESLQFDFDTIRIATDGFSDANQLGRGGFGAVYKVIPSFNNNLNIRLCIVKDQISCH